MHGKFGGMKRRPKGVDQGRNPQNSQQPGGRRFQSEIRKRFFSSIVNPLFQDGKLDDGHYGQKH